MLFCMPQLHETIHLGVKKYEVVFVADDFRISIKKLAQGLPDTGINHNFLPFTPFLFFDPKSLFDVML